MKRETALQKLLRASAFAADKHRKCRRKDVEATPYINHPIEVANVLSQEAGIHEVDVLVAALLHDTIEDTDTRKSEIAKLFGKRVARIVAEVSDDKRLPKSERKRLQVEHAAHISKDAKLVKLADKTVNLRDMATNPPALWSLARRREYFDWAKEVVDQARGVNPKLEAIFDKAHRRRP